jgi:hypothetical protein
VANPPRRQTSHTATAIMRYNTDQTGPNIQLGGIQEGLTNPAYQVGTEGVMKRDPDNPTPKHTPTHAARPKSERAVFIVTS